MAAINRTASYRWEIVVGFTYLVGLISYLLIIREWIPQVYEGTAPNWFQELIHGIYPRFAIEKSRFNLPFFLAKADQVIIRAGLVLFLGLGISIIAKKSIPFQQSLVGFWSGTNSLTVISQLRKSYAVVIFLSIFDWYFSLMDLSQLSVFYEPILLLKILHIPLVSPTVMQVLVVGFIISLVFIFLGRWTWQASLLSGGCFLLFQAYFQSFGKIAHTFTPFVYAALLVPFLFFEEQKAKSAQQITVQNWPLSLLQIAIACCYLFSGLEKLFISQLDWLKPDTLIAYIELHQAPIGLSLLQFDSLMYVLPFAALAFQLGFISIIFYPKLKWVFLPAGLFFHWGTFALLGIGWWIHPWQVAYLFFLVDVQIKKG